MLTYEVIGNLNHIHLYDLRGFKGRVMYTTDVHGSFDQLDLKLSRARFDKSRDLLLGGGDWTDRGAYSACVLDYLGEPWVKSVQGNHELLFIDGFDHNWHHDNGSVQILARHGGGWIAGLTPEHERQIYNTFQSLPLAMKVIFDWGTVGLIHAEVPYGDWERFENNFTHRDMVNGSTCQWSRLKYKAKDDRLVKNIDHVLVGHTVTKSKGVEQLGNVRYVDGGACFEGGQLNMLELTNGIQEID